MTHIPSKVSQHWAMDSDNSLVRTACRPSFSFSQERVRLIYRANECLSHPDLNRFFNLAVINRKVEECPSLRMAMDVFLGAGIQEK